MDELFSAAELPTSQFTASADEACLNYLCPGEAIAIDRGTHLARLAAFYPPCRTCSHRSDVRELSVLQQRQWEELEARAQRAPQWTAEGFVGTLQGGITPSDVARIAEALAVVLQRKRAASPKSPTVLVASDGNWATIDFVAAACQALQLSGCRAVEVGAVSAPTLAMMAQRSATEAAVWLGNFDGEPHSLGVKLWTAAGCPASSPGDLDAIKYLHAAPAPRPRRRGGDWGRLDIDPAYLATLAPIFHALRPLRFVLDTRCKPLVRSWVELSLPTACEMLRPAQTAGASGAVDASQPASSQRMQLLSEEVLAAGAHFGMWIDGDGETCLLVDEWGKPVDGERLLLAFAAYLGASSPGATILLEPAASSELEQTLVALGLHPQRGGPTRQVMFEAMSSQSALLGGGASGRYWFAGPPVAADALLTLSLLLALVSQTDGSLSEVLDLSKVLDGRLLGG